MTEKTQEQINADEAVRKYVNQALEDGLPVVAICADKNNKSGNAEGDIVMANADEMEVYTLFIFAILAMSRVYPCFMNTVITNVLVLEQNGIQSSSEVTVVETDGTQTVLPTELDKSAENNQAEQAVS